VTSPTLVRCCPKAQQRPLCPECTGRLPEPDREALTATLNDGDVLAHLLAVGAAVDWLRAHPQPPVRPHGTRSNYVNGPCRCKPCTDANAAYQLDAKHKRKAQREGARR
jgi:hypothetical protein